MTVASRSSSSARGRIIAAITREASESARSHPVARMTRPATTASTEPSRSANTSVAAARRLSEPVSERRRIVSETALAASPTSANATIGPASTSTGSASRLEAGVRQVGADPEQHQRVDQGREDLGAVVAEGRALARRDRRDVRRAQRQDDGRRVGGHVARVGQQRQGAGQPGTHELDGEHHAGEGQHQPEPGPVGGAARRVTVLVSRAHVPEPRRAIGLAFPRAAQVGTRREPAARPARRRRWSAPSVGLDAAGHATPPRR